ncbi:MULTISPECIES: hypothetical protein [unclassified Caballeronia]|uniref:hypothetical protein n=1 Tax=unclassified Caballeronia TaxID=2646786 RepID=UPI0020287294|nr:MULTISPECIES: hypothetical protein [unclassified Caballeronia]MDR5768097.1 hypothetical protein [Caballeronia sp. LZ028]
MSVTSHSPESRAAVRFMAATRKVEVAFRAAREVARAGVTVDNVRAQSQLEFALEELAKAEVLFDATVNHA